MVSTPLKNISQNGNLPQIGVNIKNIGNHHLDNIYLKKTLQKAMFFLPPLEKKKGPQDSPDLGWRLLTDAMYPAGSQGVSTKNRNGISRRWNFDMLHVCFFPKGTSLKRWCVSYSLLHMWSFLNLKGDISIPRALGSFFTYAILGDQR